MPQTLAIKDPEAKNAIEALVSAHNVRNGFVGSGDNQFITKAEAQALIDASTSSVSKKSVNTAVSSTPVTDATPFSRYVQLTDEAVDPLAQEVIGWGVDITQKNVNGHIVCGHFHGVSTGRHVGHVWGFATEAYNGTGKIGGQETQLYGGEVSIINMIPNSIAARHAGLLVVFKNRLDNQNYNVFKPLGTTMNAGESFNRNTSALYLDAGAGRTGSSSDLIAGNINIPCGWQRGVYFSPTSLDESFPNAGDAVGIDMSQFEGYAPENVNRRLYQRMKAAIALPPNTPITWDGAGFAVKTQFNNGNGNFEFKVGNSVNAAINFSNGIYYGSNGVEFLSLKGNGTSALFWMESGGRIDSRPLGEHVYAGMIRIIIDGSSYKLPFFL